ncbi:MAG: hypothetical protein M9894_25225 [Planctomycetes bacterium]|nr:hypothetical protein [Planctomycetota bacterium]
MSTALAPAAPALTFALAPLGDGRLLGAVAAPGPRPLVALLDRSGSLAGPPLEQAADLVRRLAAARPCAVVATGPRVLRAAGPARDAPLQVTAEARADLPAALDLAHLEAARAGGVPFDLVLVSDLALAPAEAEALRAAERAGARLHLVLAPSPRPARADLPAHARLGEGDPLAALLERLGPPARGDLEVALAAPPRAWYAWRAGRLQGGAPADLARVARPVGVTVAFVVDAPPAGEAALVLGEQRQAVALDPARAGDVDPDLLAAVRLDQEGAS